MTRKLVSNIILGLIGVLALALIIMAIVPKSFSIGVSATPYQIAVYGTNSNSNAKFVDNGSTKEEYKKLSELYANSLSTSALDALFSKKITYRAKYEYDGSDYLSHLISKDGRIVMELKFNKMQILKQGGKDYVNDALKTISAYDKGIATYGKVWVSVQDTNGFGEIEFYFQRLNEKGNCVSSSNNTVLKVTTLANTHNLYTELKKIQNAI